MLTDGFKLKIASAGCTVLISNKIMQLLSHDDTVIHALLTTINYRIIRFSQYLWQQIKLTKR